MSVRLAVKVVPGAVREGIEAFGDGLKIKVRAAPEKGRANAAVSRLLAERLALPASAVRVVAGHTGRQKLLEVDMEDADALWRALDL